MKLRHFLIYLAALAALFTFCGPVPSLALAEKDPELGRIVVTSDEGRLLLSASVQDALNSRLRQELAEGGELNFVFSVELVHKGGGWFDDTLRKFSFSRTLRYDKERGDYLFTPDGRESPRRTASLREAEEWMSSFSRVPVADLSALVPDEPYAIRMQAVLKRGVPVLGRLVPIGPFGGIRTDRRTIEFRY